MSAVAIVYFSQTEMTAALAHRLATGLKKSGIVDVYLFRIQGEEIVAGRFVN